MKLQPLVSKVSSASKIEHLAMGEKLKQRGKTWHIPSLPNAQDIIVAEDPALTFHQKNCPWTTWTTPNMCCNALASTPGFRLIKGSLKGLPAEYREVRSMVFQ